MSLGAVLTFLRSACVGILFGAGLVGLGVGLWGVVTALRTGHQDPYHGGGMLLAGGLYAAAAGLGALLLAVGLWYWWGRTEHPRP